MTRKSSLTPANIETLKDGKLLDLQTPGLSIEVVKGKPVWHFRRRIAGSKSIFKRCLGAFPVYSIAAARAWAGGFNKQLDAGIDPRKAELEAAEHNSLTVAVAHAKYMVAVLEGRSSRAKRRIKPRTINEKDEMYKAEIGPAIGGKLIFDVTEGDLTKLVLAIGKRAKVRANRVAGELKVFFGWAASLRGTEVGLSISPATRLTDLKFPEVPRTRTLTMQEIGFFLRALGTIPRLYQRGMLLWLLTAARLSEVIHARSEEYANGIWMIPADRVKNSRAHRIALGPWGRSLIRSNSEWVFASERIEGPRAACGWYKAKQRVLLEMSRLAGRPIENWTPHDLRRTARSNTKRLHVDFETAEAMLNHTKTGLERIYDSYTLDEEKRDWFYRWEEEIVRIAIEVGVAGALGVPDAPEPRTARSVPAAWPRRHATRAPDSRSTRVRRRA